jgi:hypothetical protein
MQGYLFSPAKPAAEIRQLFHREQPADADLRPRPRQKRRQIPTTA